MFCFTFCWIKNAAVHSRRGANDIIGVYFLRADSPRCGGVKMCVDAGLRQYQNTYMVACLLLLLLFISMCHRYSYRMYITGIVADKRASLKTIGRIHSLFFFYYDYLLFYYSLCRSKSGLHLLYTYTRTFAYPLPSEILYSHRGNTTQWSNFFSDCKIIFTIWVL